jgi:hypothetical protein
MLGIAPNNNTENIEYFANYCANFITIYKKIGSAPNTSLIIRRFLPTVNIFDVEPVEKGMEQLVRFV